jgi:signal peptidase I
MTLISRLLDCLSIQFVRVRGDSMAPTISSGRWAIVNRRACVREGPSRFDIVRLEDPSQPGRWVIKRVVGLPGEHVCLADGRLFINDALLAEPAAHGGHDGARHEWWLRAGEYIVLGDNRAHSTDSRRYGPVPAAAIRGRVIRGPALGAS